MRIEVTQEHIDEGKKGSCACCPIALAAEAVGMDRPLVMRSSILLMELDIIYRLPQIAKDFITTFDHGGPVQPFSFEVQQ